MAQTWDAEMQERFEKLADTVGAYGHQFDAIERRFDAVDKRFDAVDERLDQIDKRFDAVDERLDKMDKRFDAVDGRLDKMDKRFGEMEERLLDAFKVQTEFVRDLVMKAAEGYGATVERIERGLQESRRDWDARLTLHDRVLTDHAGRITALERRKKH